MIAFQRNDVTLVSLSETDVRLVLGYLRYSEYIFRTLAGLPKEVADPIKLMEWEIRNRLGYPMSTQVAEFSRLYETYRNEIDVCGVVTIPYYATIAVTGTARDWFAGIPNVRAALDMFDTRCPQRYERPSEEAKQAVDFLLDALKSSYGSGYVWWNNGISLPAYSAQEITSFNTIHRGQQWQQIFPRLFRPRRDTTPVRAAITKVLERFAADRRVPVEHVQRALGIKF